MLITLKVEIASILHPRCAFPREIATAEAAKLVLTKLQKVLSDTTSHKKLIQSALVPVFGIRWGAQAIGRITRDTLRRILWTLRNSKLDAETYQTASLLWHTSSETENDCPHAWSQWGTTIERFNLDDECKLLEWIEVIDTFIKNGWGSPSKLARCLPRSLKPP